MLESLSSVGFLRDYRSLLKWNALILLCEEFLCVLGKIVAPVSLAFSSFLLFGYPGNCGFKKPVTWEECWVCSTVFERVSVGGFL